MGASFLGHTMDLFQYLSNSQSIQRRNKQKRRAVLVTLFLGVFITIIASGFLLLESSAKSDSAPLTATFIKKTKPAIKPTTTDAGGSSTPKKVAASVATAPTTPSCTPLSAAIRPVAPTLVGLNSGLYQLPTTTVNYTVYGATTKEISNQIHTCSPVVHGGSRYAASAEYAINWSYNYKADETGLCSIVDARVGLHIVKLLPKWQPIGSPSNLLQSKWNVFITNLNRHEDGHASIDMRYAEKLLADLSSFPPMECSQIDAAANAKAKYTINELNIANETYDNSTNHGTTEGAFLQ